MKRILLSLCLLSSSGLFAYCSNMIPSPEVYPKRQNSTIYYHDSLGRQQGSSNPSSDGGYNHYDSLGGYQGKTVPSWDGNGYTTYDSLGRQTGSTSSGW